MKESVSPGITTRPLSAAAEMAMFVLRSLSFVVVVVKEDTRPKRPSSWASVIAGSTLSPCGMMTAS